MPGMAGEIRSERLGDFKSEWWARLSRNAGRDRAEIRNRVRYERDRRRTPMSIITWDDASEWGIAGFASG
jgi:hypothetical protein